MTAPLAHHPRGTPAPIGPPRRRAGLTFIEVIAAAALLAGLASIILGSISFMESTFARQKHRLQAMEVAHRVIAQYIDNPDLLPDPKLPIQQGENFYRYALEEEVLVRETSADERIGRRIARRKEGLSVEDSIIHMLNKLTVRVYLDDPAHPALDSNKPIVSLTRIFDPLTGRPEDVALKTLLDLVQRYEREEAARRRNAAKAGGR